AHIEALVPVLDIVEIADAVGLDPASTAQAYFALGERLELHWLREQIVALPRDTRWDAMARSALRDDVYAEQGALTADVLRGGSAPITIAPHPRRVASPMIRFVALRVASTCPDASTPRRLSASTASPTISRCTSHSPLFGSRPGFGSPKPDPQTRATENTCTRPPPCSASCAASSSPDAGMG